MKYILEVSKDNQNHDHTLFEGFVWPILADVGFILRDRVFAEPLIFVSTRIPKNQLRN